VTKINNESSFIFGLCVAGAGLATGIGSAVLTKLGNPVDGGISIACFLRDVAGSFGLHGYGELSYLRPELFAIVLGATISSLASRKFHAVGGSSSLLRFIIGIILSVGIFTFIGCPLRTGLRLAGGDPAALPSLAGLIAGAWTGTQFLKRGFALEKCLPTTFLQGTVFHGIMVLLLVLLLMQPSFITLSKERHAPLLASLGAGAVIGIMAQKSKLCFIGGIRNFFLIRDFTLLYGCIFLVLGAFLANLMLGQFHFGVTIIGSSDLLWNFLSLFLVGFGSVLVGGCPFRQIILAAQGNTDSVLTLAGIAIGSSVAYNVNIAFVAGSIEMMSKIAILTGISLLLLIAFFNKPALD